MAFEQFKNMKSGGGVLCISALQLVVGLCLLGIYEGYKTNYFPSKDDEAKPEAAAETNFNFRSPMDFLFYLAMVNNIFAVFGLAGVLNAQRELVTAFFTYNAVAIVVSFHMFVDVCTDVKIRYAGERSGLTAYEQAAAAFVFFNLLLAIAATVFAVKAIDEIKMKQREDYSRMTVLSDVQYDVDT